MAEPNMIKLSWWEEFIVASAISFLTVLEGKITNPAELAGIQSAVDFLKKLMTGSVSAA